MVSRFVEVFSRRMGKQITSIPSETLDAFTSYSWPGNVRELQNLVERAVILSNDEELANPLPTQDSNSATVTAVQGRFWVFQRSLILQALQAAGWIIGGPRGAAKQLGLKRTTLIAKMKKLGISRPGLEDDKGQFSEQRQNEESWLPSSNDILSISADEYVTAHTE